VLLVPVLHPALRPDPDTARVWVERELARPEYHQGLLERLYGWLVEEWYRLQAAALDASPLSTAASIVVVTLLVVVVVLVASRVRREPLRSVRAEAGPVGSLVSAEEHRRNAESALASGRVDEALVEAFRAIAARAVQRGVLEERPGLTADELTAGLSPFFPDHSGALAQASTKFDLVFYGDVPATAQDARAVLELDEALRVARPVRASTTALTGAPPR
jgi:hypothetical protein